MFRLIGNNLRNTCLDKLYVNELILAWLGLSAREMSSPDSVSVLGRAFVGCLQWGGPGLLSFA